MTNSSLEIYQKQTNRRLEGLEKNIELILKILNKFVDDMEPAMDNVENAIRATRETQHTVKDEMKKELKQLQFSVEDKVEDVQKTLNNKEMVIVPKERFSKIKKLLKIK